MFYPKEAVEVIRFNAKAESIKRELSAYDAAKVEDITRELVKKYNLSKTAKLILSAMEKSASMRRLDTDIVLKALSTINCKLNTSRLKTILDNVEEFVGFIDREEEPEFVPNYGKPNRVKPEVTDEERQYFETAYRKLEQ